MAAGNNPNYQQMSFENLQPRFSLGFLEDHAGSIMSDPMTALVELVANAWDAGADCIEIDWPENATGIVGITDNGTGMTFQEFNQRWPQLSYNRLVEQGDDVEFPEGNRTSKRKAFGRNGKGRHAMFCFSHSYTVSTWKNGEYNEFLVTRTQNSYLPFDIKPVRQDRKEGHGTKISAKMNWTPLSIQSVKDLIGSKFVADPSLTILVNNTPVQLTDLKQSDTHKLEINGVDFVIIHHLFSEKAGRTTKQHGVAWWVKKRLVGEPSWTGFDDIPYIDGRRTEARHHTFVVEADLLAEKVKADWSGFQETELFNTVHAKVKEYIADQLANLMSGYYEEQKITAVQENLQEVKELPVYSRYQLGQFLSEMQKAAPTIRPRDLSAVVKVVSKLEKSRMGFTLLEQLSKLNPNEIDKLSEILSKWTVQEASLVLNELERRLKLIENLERLMNDPKTDELHDLQPLFDVGLWIFGPEYESIEFTSNRTLVTVIETFLQSQLSRPLSNPRKRPDFVVLPNSTIGLYSSNSYDKRSEVNGFAKLLIIELKRGGFEINRKEKNQALEYASEIRKSGKIQNWTEITAFVLGSRIADDASDSITEGKTIVTPRTYDGVLSLAHARTFNLLKNLEKLHKDSPIDNQLLDPTIEKVLTGKVDLFTVNEQQPVTDENYEQL